MKQPTAIIAGCVLALMAVVPEANLSGQDPSGALSSRDSVIHLLQRATYGPLPGDIVRVQTLGIQAWLEEQMRPDAIENAGLEARLEAFPAATMEIEELLAEYPPGQVLQPVREMVAEGSMSQEERRAVQRQLTERSPGRILADLVGTRLTRAVYSERQLEEMMNAFWFDHFNVFFGKGAVRWLVGDYERSAIRPHVFGKFEDMVLATARHPAMLFYLDNFRSVAPDSSLAAQQRRRRMARRDRRGPSGPEARRRRAGLNENYARELMELHTLGVDGGYTQDDIVAVARILTGWTFQPIRRDRMMAGRQATLENGTVLVPTANYEGAYRFRFRRELHDAGEKTVMGHRFRRGKGEDEGVELIRMLARHPSTAQHIATQLATRFVSDDPPEALVDRLANVFMESEGDLAAVTRALFTSPEFYSAEVVGMRTKSPFTLVASTLRLTGARVSNPRVLLTPLRTLGEAPYLAEPPTGYEESSESWASSGAMLNRMNFAAAIASGAIRGVRLDGRALLERVRILDDDRLDGMARLFLPAGDTSELLRLIREDLATDPAPDVRSAAVRELSLILGSPEFQRH